MLKFIAEIQETCATHFGPDGSLSDKTESNLGAKLTHQITQISVFHQLAKDRADFILPPKKVSGLARLAKQIVVLDHISIPRQTRSQFTLTVLEMLKASQEHVRERKRARDQPMLIDDHQSITSSQVTTTSQVEL